MCFFEEIKVLFKSLCSIKLNILKILDIWRRLSSQSIFCTLCCKKLLIKNLINLSISCIFNTLHILSHLYHRISIILVCKCLGDEITHLSTYSIACLTCTNCRTGRLYWLFPSGKDDNQGHSNRNDNYRSYNTRSNDAFSFATALLFLLMIRIVITIDHALIGKRAVVGMKILHFKLLLHISISKSIIVVPLITIHSISKIN